MAVAFRFLGLWLNGLLLCEVEVERKPGCAARGCAGVIASGAGTVSFDWHGGGRAKLRRDTISYSALLLSPSTSRTSAESTATSSRLTILPLGGLLQLVSVYVLLIVTAHHGESSIPARAGG